MNAQLVPNINDTNQMVFHEPFIASIQAQAIIDFNALGLPTKAHEDWKYTSTESFKAESFRLSGDGAVVRIPSLPSGVVVVPLKEAFTKYQDLIKPYFNQIMKTQHGFHALNTALFHSGYLIYVPEGIQVEAPLNLLHTEVMVGEARCVRHLVILEQNSKLDLVESFIQTQDKPYFTNVVTEIVLAEHARLSHTKIQSEGQAAYHVGDVFVYQSEHSHFESHSLSLGGSWTRSDTHVSLKAKGAQCLMNGIYLPKGRQHVDHHTTILHEVPGAMSTQDYKGIMQDYAQAVFNGKVRVAQDAIQTTAKQYNKNILLSKSATVNTKPELQIFADDVTCAHGATVGALDDEALFYLSSRGIEQAQAEQFLIEAFLADNVKLMAVPEVSSFLEQHLSKHMECV